MDEPYEGPGEDPLVPPTISPGGYTDFSSTVPPAISPYLAWWLYGSEGGSSGRSDPSVKYSSEEDHGVAADAAETRADYAARNNGPAASSAEQHYAVVLMTYDDGPEYKECIEFN